MKTCYKCKTVKSLEAFSKLSRSKDGRQSKCKDCFAEYYKQNAEKQKQAYKDWRSIPENIERARETRKAYLQTDAGKDAKRSDKMRRRSLTRTGDRVAMSDLISLYGDTCLFPGCVRTDIEMDHVIPLSLGGAHALENLQPLCKTHNAAKGNRNSNDYRGVTI